MEDLTTVPTFNFSQGDVFEGAENLIQVCYYSNGVQPMIELNQDGDTVTFTDFAQLEKLVKNIRKNLNEAKQILNK